MLGAVSAIYNIPDALCGVCGAMNYRFARSLCSRREQAFRVLEHTGEALRLRRVSPSQTFRNPARKSGCLP